MRFPIAIVLVVAVALLSDARAEPATSATRVVLLGSGTPNPEPDRSGPAVAIVVNDTPYLVDFGPGVVRRAAAMSPSYGGEIEALETEKLGIAFLTHLHSDHSAGLPDLYDADIRYRVDGLEPANDQGWRVNAHEIESGLIYSDENVQVEAFRVRHGDWENAYGYRFTTPDRVIVISGDAAPDANIEAFAKGADILLHEVYSVSGFARRNEFWQKYHRNNHTSAHELGEIATRVQPRLLVLYHVLFWGSSEEVVLDEVREKYSGYRARTILGPCEPLGSPQATVM
jgi:ribonuclease Z